MGVIAKKSLQVQRTNIKNIKRTEQKFFYQGVSPRSQQSNIHSQSATGINNIEHVIPILPPLSCSQTRCRMFKVVQLDREVCYNEE